MVRPSLKLPVSFADVQIFVWHDDIGHANPNKYVKHGKF